MSSSKLLEQLWHKSGSCPEGTIPIQRTRKRHLLGARSLADASAQLEVSYNLSCISFGTLIVEMMVIDSLELLIVSRRDCCDKFVNMKTYNLLISNNRKFEYEVLSFDYFGAM